MTAPHRSRGARASGRRTAGPEAVEVPRLSTRQPGCGQRRFCAELRHWRVLRGLSQQDLGERVLYSREFVALVERAERWPTQDFAGRADAVLDTGGALLASWPAVEVERLAAIPPKPPLARVLPFWQPRVDRATSAEPRAGGALAALVGNVLHDYPGARIVIAIDPGGSDPVDARAVCSDADAVVVHLGAYRAVVARRQAMGNQR